MPRRGGTQAYVLFYLRQSPEKDHERKRLLSAIVAFHEEERRELAAASCKDDGDADNGEPMENGSADSDLTKNGIVSLDPPFRRVVHQSSSCTAVCRSFYLTLVLLCGPGVIKRKKYFVCDEWLTRWKCTLSPGRIDNARYFRHPFRPSLVSCVPWAKA
jgi:hypothetical protein